MAVVNKPCRDTSHDCSENKLVCTSCTDVIYPLIACFSLEFQLFHLCLLHFKIRRMNKLLSPLLLKPPVLLWQLDFLSTSLAVVVLFVENNAEWETRCQVRVWYRIMKSYGITSSGSVCGLPVEGAAFDMCHTSVILFTSHFILFILPFLHLLTLLLFSPISPFFKRFP